MNTSVGKRILLVASSKSIKRVKKKSKSISKRYLVTPEDKKRFYLSREWEDLKRWVYSNHTHKCFCCYGVTELQVDHIIPISTTPWFATSTRNLQILCKQCNQTKSNTSSLGFKRLKIRGYRKYEGFVTFESWKKFFPKKESYSI
jgi:5-methylcytosine-specific restriction protein A